MRQSNVMLSSTLRLRFLGLTETEMLSILAHYQGQLGTFTSFELPDDVFSGVADADDYTISGYSWRYDEPPSVEDLPCGNHNVELTLATVPPEGAAVAGLSGFILVTFTPGTVAVSNGITATIRARLAGGTPTVAADGITQSITTTLEPGTASGA